MHIVYQLQDPRDGSTFYVGKSLRGWERGDRHARGWHIRCDRNMAKVNRIVDILNAGLEPLVWPVAFCRTAREAFEIETSVIRQWSAAGVPLLNLTNNRGRRAA
jgi:hypothetical protein